jgi:hypothetical protein
MIQMPVERRVLPREIINLPALLSFDGISGVHCCVVHNINAFGACLSTPYYMFPSNFDLSFSGFHRTFACRVAWRRATLSGVVFVLRRRAPNPVSKKVELASIIQHNLPKALPPIWTVEACLPEGSGGDIGRHSHSATAETSDPQFKLSCEAFAGDRGFRLF